MLYALDVKRMNDIIRLTKWIKLVLESNDIKYIDYSFSAYCNPFTQFTLIVETREMTSEKREQLYAGLERVDEKIHLDETDELYATYTTSLKQIDHKYISMEVDNMTEIKTTAEGRLYIALIEQMNMCSDPDMGRKTRLDIVRYKVNQALHNICTIEEFKIMNENLEWTKRKKARQKKYHQEALEHLDMEERMRAEDEDREKLSRVDEKAY